MNDETAMEETREELATCQVLASLFLDLPNEQNMAQILGFSDSVKETDGPFGLLVQFAKDNAHRPMSEVLEEVARDRVLLVRGMGLAAIKPPYESVYQDSSQGEAMASLNRFYRDCGFRQLPEVHEAGDQIGVQFAFMASLLERKIDQMESGDVQGAAMTEEQLCRFFADHLGRWADKYADAVIAAAITDYWRAVGLMIKAYSAARTTA